MADKGGRRDSAAERRGSQTMDKKATHGEERRSSHQSHDAKTEANKEGDELDAIREVFTKVQNLRDLTRLLQDTERKGKMGVVGAEQVPKIAKDLMAEMQSGAVGLVREEGSYCAFVERLTLQLRSGTGPDAWICVNTHQRSDYGTAQVTSRVEVSSRNFLKTYVETVEDWLEEILGVSRESLANLYTLAGTFAPAVDGEAEALFPGLSTITRTSTAEVQLLQHLHAIVPGMRDCRPFVHMSKADGKPQLWSWWPSSTVQAFRHEPLYQPMPQPHIRQIPEEIRYLIGKALGTRDLKRHVLALLRWKPNGLAASVMLAKLPATSLAEDRLVLMVVDREGSSEAGDMFRLAGSLVRLDAERVARPLEKPTGPGTGEAARASVWLFALDQACWTLPEMVSLGTHTEMLALVEDVVNDALEKDFSKLAGHLAHVLPNLVAEIVGPKSLLSRMHSEAQRSEHDLLLTYEFVRSARTQVTEVTHSPYDPRMGKLLRRLGLLRPEEEEGNELQVVLAALDELQGLTMGLRGVSLVHWRPLVCPAHGCLTLSRMVADMAGRVWLYGGTNAHGPKPIFWDLARLLLDILLQGCRLPIRIDHVLIVATENWVKAEDLQWWFGLTKKGATALKLKAAEIVRRSRGDEDVSRMGRSYYMDIVQAISTVEPDLPDHEALGALQTCVVLVDMEVDEVWKECCLFADAFPDQLNPLFAHVHGARPPKGLTGRRLRAWELLVIVLRANAQGYNQMLTASTNLNKQNGIAAVDSSKLLLQLPMLQYTLQMLGDTTVPPWQKPWLLRLVQSLTRKLVQALPQLDEPATGLQVTPFAETPVCPGVEFAGQHRFFVTYKAEPFKLLEAEHAQGKAPLPQAIFPVSVARCGGTPEAIMSRDIPQETGPGCPLFGMPCPPRGLTIAQIDEMRRCLNAHSLNSPSSQAERRRVAAALERERINNLWRSDICGFYEIVSIVGREALGDKYAESRRKSLTESEIESDSRGIALVDGGPGLTLRAEMLEELKVLGRPVGVAGVATPEVHPCPRSKAGREHKKSQRTTISLAYARFPCASCNGTIDLSREGATSFAHCTKCWEDDGKTFDLCQECMAVRVPQCPSGHVPEELCGESPYDGTPLCAGCRREIPPIPAWDDPEGWKRPSPSWPHSFHCCDCRGEGHPDYDLCTDCARPTCPVGHKLSFWEVAKPVPGSDAKMCCSCCGEEGGTLAKFFCATCQEGHCEVEYPDGAAMRKDLELSNDAAPIVKSVAPGGIAEVAGVHAGYRWLGLSSAESMSPQVRERLLASSEPFVAVFEAGEHELKYDDNDPVQQDVTLVWHDGILTVQGAVPRGHAAKAGIGRGCRLHTINGSTVEDLGWDGATALRNVPGLEAPYLITFLAKGRDYLLHPGCGISCANRHAMEAQFPGFLICSNGHAMKRARLDDPKLRSLPSVCDGCREPFASSGSLEIFLCRICRPEVGRRQCPSPSAEQRPRRMLCKRCAEETACAARSETPYRNEGEVRCVDCGRSVLERMPTAGAEPTLTGGALTAAQREPFFHCGACWQSDGTRYDLCRSCSVNHLHCAISNHEMQVWTESPYAANVECASCGRDLPRDSCAYHCGDCWQKSCTRSNRCLACAERTVIEYNLDDGARFLALSAEESWPGLHWEEPFSPQVTLTIAGDVTLLMSLQLKGFLYPRNARVHLGSEFGDRDGTVFKILDKGKYEVHLDGDRDKVTFDPQLSNHVPAGVWRYAPGQRLIYHGEQGWVDVRVKTVEEQGNYHVLEELHGERTVHNVAINTWNHAPLWLRSEQWLREQRRWDARQLVWSMAVDVLTGRHKDVFQLVWNVRDLQDKEAAALEGRAGEESEEGEEEVPPSPMPNDSDLETRHNSPLHDRTPSLRTPVPPSTPSRQVATPSYQAMRSSSHRMESPSLRLESPTAGSPDPSPAHRAATPLARRVKRLRPPNATWRWLMGFTAMSPQRHRGVHEAHGVIVVGEKASGKTSLLRRLAAEAVKAHGGEIVPLYVDTFALLQSLPRETVRHELAFGDFLTAHLQATYGEGHATFLFLRQALWSRRVLLLVDGLDCAPRDVRTCLLRGLGYLVVVGGHRMVAAMRPDPDWDPDNLASSVAATAGADCPSRSLRYLELAALDANQRAWLARTRLQPSPVMSKMPSIGKSRSGAHFKVSKTASEASALTHQRGEKEAEYFLQRLEGYDADFIRTAPVFDLFLRHAERETAGGKSLRAGEAAESSRVSSMQSSKTTGIDERPSQSRNRMAGVLPQLKRAGTNSLAQTVDLLQKRRSQERLEAAMVEALKTKGPAPGTMSHDMEAVVRAACAKLWRQHGQPAAKADDAEAVDAEQLPEAPKERPDSKDGSRPGSKHGSRSGSKKSNRSSSKTKKRSSSKTHGAGGSRGPTPPPDEPIDDEPGPPRTLLGKLALFMLTQGADVAAEHMIKQLGFGNPELDQAWCVMEPVVSAHKFFPLVIRPFIDERGQPQRDFCFADPSIQWYLACVEVLELWGTSDCPLESVEQLLGTPRWKPMVPFFAEQLTAPVSIKLNSLEHAEATLLARFLARSSTVTKLTCEKVGLGQRRRALQELAGMLEKDGQLQHVDLGENGLGSDGAEQICLALSKHPRLESLNLRDNHIGHTGAEHVAVLLRRSATLASLDLAGNSIGPEGAMALANALPESRSLSRLDLQRNNIGGHEVTYKWARMIKARDRPHTTVDTHLNRKDFPEQFVSPPSLGGRLSRGDDERSPPNSPFALGSARGSPSKAELRSPARDDKGYPPDSPLAVDRSMSRRNSRDSNGDMMMGRSKTERSGDMMMGHSRTERSSASRSGMPSFNRGMTLADMSRTSSDPNNARFQDGV